MSAVWEHYADLAPFTKASFFDKSKVSDSKIFSDGDILPTYEITGKIPRKTFAYDKIIKFWLVHYGRPWTYEVHDMFIIENDIEPPIEYISPSNLHWHGMYVSRKWLKNFLSPIELTNLIATRMEEDQR